jgi:hypothetical protein
VDVGCLTVELGQFRFKVRAHRSHDLVHPGQVRGGEHRVSERGDELSACSSGTTTAFTQSPASIHLGSTLYGSRWWGTRVNPEAKLLLIAHCFEDCGYGRVRIQTDVLNTRSQAASPSSVPPARASCGGT